MNIKKYSNEIAVTKNNTPVIFDTQSALDFAMHVKYETGCNIIIMNKEAVCEDFFDLSTKIAGEILQKYMNYGIKLAITGDFSGYTSKSLKDFIYESNKNRCFLFVSNTEEAIDLFLE